MSMQSCSRTDAETTKASLSTSLFEAVNARKRKLFQRASTFYFWVNQEANQTNLKTPNRCKRSKVNTNKGPRLRARTNTCFDYNGPDRKRRKCPDKKVHSGNPFLFDIQRLLGIMASKGQRQPVCTWMTLQFCSMRVAGELGRAKSSSLRSLAKEKKVFSSFIPSSSAGFSSIRFTD